MCAVSIEAIDVYKRQLLTYSLLIHPTREEMLGLLEASSLNQFRLLQMNLMSATLLFPETRSLSTSTGFLPVSYTHLDVYKRQLYQRPYDDLRRQGISHHPWRR